MRSIEDYRARTLELLHHICMCPGMYGSGSGLEILFRHVIENLCWIDEQEENFEKLICNLKQRNVFCQSGVYVTLATFFHGVDSLNDELASIYCQLAYQLGYIKVERILTPSEWAEITRWFDKDNLTEDLRLNDIKSMFGNPSFYTRGNCHQVHCYAGPKKSDGWFCFDYSNKSRSWTDETGSHFEWVYGDNFILRNRRRTAGKFSEMIDLTPFGRKHISSQILE